MKRKIALFASGKGSNVYNIIAYFKNNSVINVSLVCSNKKNAGALTHAKNADIETFTFNREDLFETNTVLTRLKNQQIDYIVLAGFLWKIPENLLREYKDKIINVHPSLLPKYGGKGMYGQNVHKAVLKNKEQQTGITIHKVNEHYDEGEIIAQFTCDIAPGETLESLQKKISNLEKNHFPITIEKFITQ